MRRIILDRHNRMHGLQNLGDGRGLRRILQDKLCVVLGSESYTDITPRQKKSQQHRTRLDSQC